MGVFRYLDRWQGSIRDVWNREDQTDRLMALLEQRDRDLEDYLKIGVRHTYVPTLTATTVNPNLGASGVAWGDYFVALGICHWSASFTFFGAGVAAGTGDYLVSAPIPMKPLEFSGFRIVGTGWYYSSGGFVTIEADMSPGVSSARCVYDGGVVGAAAPAAPTAGSVLSISGSYPVLP